MCKAIDSSGYPYEYFRVASIVELENTLQDHIFDLFILDYDIPGHTIDQFLQKFKDFNELIPIIVVSGTMMEEQVVKALQFGARNYVMKVNLRRLPGTVQKEIELFRERQAYQKALKEREQALEILIREIHHRVKNNLQIITGLLDLQSLQIDDPETRLLFQESKSRVKSMALVHERIYQSEDLSRIDYRDYVEQLTGYLFDTWSPENVRYEIKTDPVVLNIDTAIPTGIILNELVTNALKHAFPNGREGNISVSLLQENNNARLVVADDGIGMSDEIDIKTSKTLGLELVNALVQQLNASVDVETGNGTTFDIRIPLN